MALKSQVKNNEDYLNNLLKENGIEIILPDLNKEKEDKKKEDKKKHTSK